MKTGMYIKIEDDLKASATDLSARMGISLSAVVSAFLRSFVQTQELHVTATPRMTPFLESVVAQVEADIQTNRNISGPFKTAAAMDKHLDSL